MPRSHVLVVACRSARSAELRTALLVRARREPTEFTLLLPAPEDDAEQARLLIREAVESLRGAGLDVAGRLGESDPYATVEEVWDPREYDELVVCTLPPGRSHWIERDVPTRLGALTGVPVQHVVASGTLR